MASCVLAFPDATDLAHRSRFARVNESLEASTRFPTFPGGSARRIRAVNDSLQIRACSNEKGRSLLRNPCSVFGRHG